MNCPSVKTIAKIEWLDKVGDAKQIAKKVRKILTDDETAEYMQYIYAEGCQDEALSAAYPATIAELRGMYSKPTRVHVKMLMLDELLHTYGIEYIPAGRNRKSPSITYLNTGGTYTTTIMFVRGQYRVGNWGDIVERGNYD